MEGRNPVDGGLDCGLRRSDETRGRGDRLSSLVIAAEAAIQETAG